MKKKLGFCPWCPCKEALVLIHWYEMLCRGYRSGKNKVIIRIVMLLILSIVNTSVQAELCLGAQDCVSGCVANPGCHWLLFQRETPTLALNFFFLFSPNSLHFISALQNSCRLACGAVERERCKNKMFDQNFPDHLGEG